MSLVQPRVCRSSLQLMLSAPGFFFWIERGKPCLLSLLFSFLFSRFRCRSSLSILPFFLLIVVARFCLTLFPLFYPRSLSWTFVLAHLDPLLPLLSVSIGRFNIPSCPFFWLHMGLCHILFGIQTGARPCGVVNTESIVLFQPHPSVPRSTHTLPRGALFSHCSHPQRIVPVSFLVGSCIALPSFT